MFVGQLTKKQVDQFIRDYLIEADFHPELPNNKRQIELFASCRGEEAIEVHYCSRFFNAHVSLFLMDDRMYPFISKELENAWLRYLDKTFEGEYKRWYMSEKAKLFQSSKAAEIDRLVDLLLEQ